MIAASCLPGNISFDEVQTLVLGSVPKFENFLHLEVIRYVMLNTVRFGVRLYMLRLLTMSVLS